MEKVSRFLLGHPLDESEPEEVKRVVKGQTPAGLKTKPSQNSHPFDPQRDVGS